MTEIIPYRGDYYPIIGQLLNEMNVAETINDIVRIPKSQAKIDVGTFTCLMILNMLGDVNIRLYQMKEFFKDKALPLIIPWKPDININHINDDRAGRVLDTIWEAGPQKIFTAVSTAAIRIHELDTHIIHGDTTSKYFEGVYDVQDLEGIVPSIKYGYSKDHRPDLKQLIFGVGTTKDGVPIIGEVADGNESDKILNGRWIKKLRSILNKDTEEILIYVADSSLITTKNIRLLDKYNIDFISRLPGTFEIEEDIKKKAIEKNNWQYLGKLSDEKDAAIYHSYSTINKIDGKIYRFIAIKSDHKDKRKLKSLHKAIKKENTELCKKLKELNKRQFVCKRDAEIEKEKFFKNYNVKYHRIGWKIKEKEERLKRKKQGRPKKNESLDTRTNYYLTGNLKINSEVYNKARELCGLFVLITSLKDETEYSEISILKRYKGQGNVERIFKFIKNPAWIGAFCLKKPERLVALGYILFIAAMIYTLWERRVRRELAKDNVLPIEGLNRIKTKKPTAYALKTVLSSIIVLSQKIENRLCIWLPKHLSKNQLRILELSGFGEDIFFFNPNRIMENNQFDSGGCEM